MSFEKLTRHGHKMYANLAGYFWLACDWCGFEFGGHEEGWKSRLVGTNEPLLCFRCAPNYIEGRGRGHLEYSAQEREETTFRVEAKEAMAGTLRDACEKLSGQMQEFLDRGYYD